MKVILSIKPHFAEMIFTGKKKYEFRRSIFANPDVKRVVVYASSPVQKIVGEFDIDSILHDEVESLWRQTHKQSGISEDYFLNYFTGKEKGFALKIKNARKYRLPKCIKKDYNRLPPQSFIYL